MIPISHTNAQGQRKSMTSEADVQLAIPIWYCQECDHRTTPGKPGDWGHPCPTIKNGVCESYLIRVRRIVSMMGGFAWNYREVLDDD